MPTTAPATLANDPHFLLTVTIVVHLGIFLGVIFFGILGIVAFWKGDGRERAYIDLFVKGDVLRILVVGSIGGAAFILAFAKVLDGAAIASIFSGIVGYVLGGMGSKSKLPAEDKNTAG